MRPGLLSRYLEHQPYFTAVIILYHGKQIVSLVIKYLGHIYCSALNDH